MGVENAIFSYGGELGDYATYKVDGIINSDKNVKALEAYKELYSFTPPGWAKSFFIEDNQAITENLAAMSMNYFAFFPALVNEASNPNAKNTGFFANPAGPERRPVRRARRPGHLDRLLFARTRKRRSSSSNGSSRTRPRRSGPSSAATPAARRCSRVAEFQNATPYNKAFYETMFKVKDFWATPEYAELLIADEPARLSLRHRRPGHGQGSARRARGRLERDLQEVQPREVSAA